MEKEGLAPATVRELVSDLGGGERAQLLQRLEKFLKKGLVKPFQ